MSPERADAAPLPASAPARRRLRDWLGVFGPGLTTGAADDDPSGIATYSVVGAQFGTGLLWSALFTWPLMAAVQMMSARIGMVTGQGLAGALRQRYPRWLVAAMAALLLLANVVNIAADLAGMADAMALLGAGPSGLYVWLFGGAIAVLGVRVRYRAIARVLKWLAFSLAAYVGTAWLCHPDWSAVLRAAVLPQWPHSREVCAALVALLGTTISPYLLFWQAGQEVEEERAQGRASLAQRQGATARELSDRALDIGTGTLMSNLAMFFIILTTALTLHAHGLRDVGTGAAAAAALRPLAGEGAYLLYTFGIVGTGLLAIPTLAGSAAYAWAETLDWRYGLDERWSGAHAFYAVFVCATLAGAALDFLRIEPIRALYWSAQLNGLLAPALLVAMLRVGGDARLLRGQPSSRLNRAVVAGTAALMAASALGMLLL